MTTSSSTSVVIAGAGPVGLALACELGLRGVDCVLVEKRDGSIAVPKQSMVSARNMEFCRRWGVADEVRGAVWPETHPRDFIYLDNLRGREVLRVKVPSQADSRKLDYTPESACPCPQIYFDPILLRRVRSMPAVHVAYNTRMDRFSQDAEHVLVDLTDLGTGAQRTVAARYLVGCDGPAGMVREALGIGLEGLGALANSVNIFFRSPRLSSIHDKGWGRFYRLIDDTGCWAELIPIDGKELWRLTVFEDSTGGADPDSALRKMAGGEFPYDILSASPWERRDFVARSYGRGRVFIAGDAAHECSPTGGIGMHTGIEEIVNLGWKLAAVLEGWGGPGLLASYEAERRPIALRNVELATLSFQAITSIPPWREASRELGADVADWRANTASLSPGEVLKMQYSYEASPICIADGTPALKPDPYRLAPTTRPGTRAPHAWLADGRSTLDLFGDGFTLVRLGEQPPDAAPLVAAAQARSVPLREIVIADASVAALYETRLVLVRPDGHVAWRGDQSPTDAMAVVDRVRGG